MLELKTRDAVGTVVSVPGPEVEGLEASAEGRMVTVYMPHSRLHVHWGPVDTANMHILSRAEGQAEEVGYR